ncbi:putative fimbrial chaperone protein ElfD [Providencia manganoxydans]
MKGGKPPFYSIKGMVVKSILTLCFSGMVALCPSYTLAGISYQLGSLRIVYPEGEKGVPLTLINNTKDEPVLTQTVILKNPSGPEEKIFYVLPSIVKISPQSSTSVKIMLKPGVSLPQDRESIFYINSKAIPLMEHQDKEEKNIAGGINIGISSVIKLFYRPQNLPMSIETAQANLRFDISGKTLKVSNASPYYITLINIKIDGQKVPLVDKGMLPPYGAFEYPFTVKKSSAASHKFQWTLINDSGGMYEYSK